MFVDSEMLSSEQVFSRDLLTIRRAKMLKRVVWLGACLFAIPIWLAVARQGQANLPEHRPATEPRPAIQFGLSQPSDLAITGDNVLYISTSRDGKDLKRLDLETGLMSVLPLDVPVPVLGSLALDMSDNLLASSPWECRIIQINRISGSTITLAGLQNDALMKPGCGSDGDQGPALKASFEPAQMIMDARGNLFILDGYHHGRIRRIDEKSRIITTVVPPSRLHDPEAIALDPHDRLFVAQTTGGPYSLLVVNPSTGFIAPVKPGNFTGNRDFWKRSSQRRRLLCDPSGNLYASDDARIYYINFHTHNVSVVAGTTKGFSGDGGLAIKAQFYMPGSMALDSAGNLYIADTENQRIRRVDAKTHIITTIAGNGLPRHIPGTIEVSE